MSQSCPCTMSGFSSFSTRRSSRAALGSTAGGECGRVGSMYPRKKRADVLRIRYTRTPETSLTGGRSPCWSATTAT